MLRISRTNTGPVGEWWFTVDRYMLFGIIFLGLSGLFFSLAVSPVEAGHLKANQYYFLIKKVKIYYLVSTKRENPPKSLAVIGVLIFEKNQRGTFAISLRKDGCVMNKSIPPFV